MRVPATTLLLLLGGLAGSLALEAPALARTSFDVIFDSGIAGTSFYNTGVKGKMSFDFRKDPGNGNTYTLDLGVTNTSPASGASSGTLVGFAFNEPLLGNGSEAISLLSYNPLSSGYGRVFGNSNRGIRVNPQESLDISNLRTAPYAPFSNFDFCARMSSRSGCHGGSGSTGITGGSSVKVQFSLKSNDASISTADQVAERFYGLFNSFEPGDRWSKAQIALRFQNVKKANGKTESGGEKVTGAAFWRIPNEGPTNEVPGPLPILGAAATFGWSRKIRRRIQAVTPEGRLTP
ncbi:MULTISPECIES: hypothetical protein [unclassified Cyanobium]|uniref:hypothetical protein n=1 Tax=unclassified Cyanobium TaxID=2627006 RepID=UPI0020CD1B0D|nr:MULTISPECIES: hypothetical protein [unclassified Cyanobium]MCP9833903.1 hypothetical protein [Cyanobium sp. La Preciosa 7G6]MCP9936667.1 hypothetical protein [Cyanobium sp. Aljojuca 7A6]